MQLKMQLYDGSYAVRCSQRGALRKEDAETDIDMDTDTCMQLDEY